MVGQLLFCTDRIIFAWHETEKCDRIILRQFFLNCCWFLVHFCLFGTANT